MFPMFVKQNKSPMSSNAIDYLVQKIKLLPFEEYSIK